MGLLHTINICVIPLLINIDWIPFCELLTKTYIFHSPKADEQHSAHMTSSYCCRHHHELMELFLCHRHGMNSMYDSENCLLLNALLTRRMVSLIRLFLFSIGELSNCELFIISIFRWKFDGLLMRWLNGCAVYCLLDILFSARRSQGNENGCWCGKLNNIYCLTHSVAMSESDGFAQTQTNRNNFNLHTNFIYSFTAPLHWSCWSSRLWFASTSPENSLWRTKFLLRWNDEIILVCIHLHVAIEYLAFELTQSRCTSSRVLQMIRRLIRKPATHCSALQCT